MTIAAQIIVKPAFSVDDQDCVYADVAAFGKEFTLQITRPQVAGSYTEDLDSGAAIYTNQGHDDNQDFARACHEAGLDFDEVEAFVIENSGAIVELDRVA